MAKNKNSGYGLALMMQISASVGPNFGRILVVSEDSDASIQKDSLAELFDPDDTGKIRFYTTLKAAYDAATSNANDVILLSAQTTHKVANGIAWTKSRIHVIGMDGGHRLVQQGTKIESTDTAADAYVLKVTGTRNTFENLKIIQVDTDALALHVVEMGGEGTVWKNCSFLFGVVDNLDQTDAHEVVCGEDSGTFINCTFGSDVLVTSVARAVMVADVVTSGQSMKSCIFKDCLWSIMSSSADAWFFKVLATSDLEFTNLFINPVYLAAINSSLSAITLDDAVESVSGLVGGNVLFVNPATNATSFCGTVQDNFKVVGPGMSLDGGTAAVGTTVGIGVSPA